MADFAQRRTMMVDTQIRTNDVTSYQIIDAMLSIPREIFVPAAQREAAYIGENILIAPRRVILEPRTLGKMLEALDIQPQELVLDLGCGQGYSAAVISRLAEAVVAVEDGDLASEAQQILAETGIDNAAVVSGSLTEGAPKHGPYDVITIEGAVEEVPQALLDQLKEGGRIGALFQKGQLGVARVGYKIDGIVSWRDVFNATAPVLPGFEAAKDFAL